jgi:ABC-type polysaccharide/polyol phosphate export permease
MSLFPLRNLFSRRALIGNLVLRDFQQRYVGSSMGWLWGIVHPAVMLISYWFVFGYVFKQKAPDHSGTTSFALYIFAGFLPWLLFQDSVQRSATSVVESSNLVTKTLFPSEVLPISIFFSNLMQHFLALLLLLGAVTVASQKIEPEVALVPVYLILLALFTVGVSWVVAGLQVFLRDTSQALAVLMTAWFWLTPIFFDRDRLPPWMRSLARLNPLAQVVDAYRRAILAGRLPAAEDFALLAGISGVTFILGGLFFRRTKRAFGDVL